MTTTEKMASLLERVKPLVGISLPIDICNRMRREMADLLAEYHKEVQEQEESKAKKRGKNVPA